MLGDTVKLLPTERLTIKSQVKKEEVTNELRKRISEMVVP